MSDFRKNLIQPLSNRIDRIQTHHFLLWHGNTLNYRIQLSPLIIWDLALAELYFLFLFQYAKVLLHSIFEDTPVVICRMYNLSSLQPFHFAVFLFQKKRQNLYRKAENL